MKELTDTFKALSDEQRLRILMLLDRKELCVCQLMGILGVAQPLVSRNLAILSRAGFLQERREGKLRFYRINARLAEDRKAVMKILRRHLKDHEPIQRDLETLQECTEFQKMTGRCDMKTFTEFLKKRRAGKGGKRR
ncbi:MAG: winged helix-turn-helix transcriptional regulator [Nitrospirae bacterium]|nr:winged helix-turn-helix transcriptional regulator [Nitrospirota bacterium]